MAPKIDFSLLERLARESCLSVTQTRPQTAFGRRLLDLSRGFHADILSDALMEEYLVELVRACERECLKLESTRPCGDDPQIVNVCDRMLDYLEGVIEIAERLDRMEHHEVEAAVLETESLLSLAVVGLEVQVAA